MSTSNLAHILYILDLYTTTFIIPISNPEKLLIYSGSVSSDYSTCIIPFYASINLVSVCQKKSKLSFYAGLGHISLNTLLFLVAFNYV